MASEATNARITEMAAQRVAAGTAGSIESATWSITHSAAYQHGMRDARTASEAARQMPPRATRPGTHAAALRRLG